MTSKQSINASAVDVMSKNDVFLRLQQHEGEQSSGREICPN